MKQKPKPRAEYYTLGPDGPASEFTELTDALRRAFPNMSPGDIQDEVIGRYPGLYQTHELWCDALQSNNPAVLDRDLRDRFYDVRPGTQRDTRPPKTDQRNEYRQAVEEYAAELRQRWGRSPVAAHRETRETMAEVYDIDTDTI